jgi:hypothetical protein
VDKQAGIAPGSPAALEMGATSDITQIAAAIGSLAVLIADLRDPAALPAIPEDPVAPEAASGAADSGTPIYRGLAPNHNAFADAQQGIASPGDVAGHADVFAHNVLDDTWTSRLTSWSTDPGGCRRLRGQERRDTPDDYRGDAGQGREYAGVA